MALSASMAVAGTLGAAAYIDAKYHIKKDVGQILTVRESRKIWEKAVKSNKISPYYLFEEACSRNPSGEAIWSRYGNYTWQEVYTNTNKYAHWFLSQGIKPGDIVGFYLHNSAEFMFAWMGLIAINAAPAMINYNIQGHALIHSLKISRIGILLVDEDPDFQGRIEGEKSRIEDELGIKCVVVNEKMRKELSVESGERPGDEYRSGVSPHSLVSLLYTSGTTGFSKAVAFTVHRCYIMGSSRGLSNGFTRMYVCMPLYHGTGGFVSIAQLCHGSTLCLGKRFSTKTFWSDVRESKATWFAFVGETARYLLANPESPLDKEHSVVGMIGNGLRPEVWNKFRHRFGISEIVEIFSSTEGMLSLLNHSRGDFSATAVGHHGALIRFLMRNVYVPVKVDVTTGVIARDPKTGLAIRNSYEEGGEILVKAPPEANDDMTFPGYFNNSEATGKKYERDILQKGDRYYRTGDALRRTSDGRWFFLDRLGDTFRWKGENVSTTEVSEVLGNYEGIVEANVYGVQLPGYDGRAGCAAIYIDPGSRRDFNFQGLLRHSKKQLPRYAVPIFLRVVKEMTPSHNNKQLKVHLRAEGVDPEKVSGAEEILYLVPGSERYEAFSMDDWRRLQNGKARL